MTATSEILDLAPPSDIDAEAGVVGSAMLMPIVLDDLALILEPADFCDRDFRVMYKHLLDMHSNQKRIDVKLFQAHVKKAGGEVKRFEPNDARHPLSVELMKVAEAMQAAPTAANAVYYAELVREQAIKRELRTAGTSIISTSHNEPDAAQALDECERMIMAIRDKRGTLTSQAMSVMNILADAMADIDKRGTDRLPWLSTGFLDLDKLMGFRKGEVTILAARPSMGKTALAMNFATNAALAGSPVLFFSLEMDRLSVAERFLSSQAQVDGMRMRAGTLTKDEHMALVKASAELSRTPLTIDDSAGQNMQGIAAVCRRQKRKHGLSLVVIDYLQLINPDSGRDPREQQVAKISKRLKHLARELEIPVLCLAQLNRQSESSKDNKPRLAHLRESGAIEQDADVVAFVHRPEYFAMEPEEKKTLRGRAEIYVEKNRNGRTGIAPLVWMAETVTFRSHAARDMDNYESSFEDFNNS